MNLTEKEIEALAWLKQHPWYGVLIKIEEESRRRVWDFILTADLSDKKQLEIIKENQIYVKARKDFVENVDKYTTEIYEPNI